MTDGKKVTTLVIHAPGYRAKRGAATRFNVILARGMGDGYAIPKKGVAMLRPGSVVVLLKKDGGGQCVQAELVCLRFTGKTTRPGGRGIRRYDVWFENPKPANFASFKNVKLTRTGVAVF